MPSPARERFLRPASFSRLRRTLASVPSRHASEAVRGSAAGTQIPTPQNIGKTASIQSHAPISAWPRSRLRAMLRFW
ncbi:MAG TPA: hypothetical protein VFS62_07650, partial [Chloroflexota bacterium]|nr:hypothetical protein [Chloroflexota bacterium]